MKVTQEKDHQNKKAKQNESVKPKTPLLSLSSLTDAESTHLVRTLVWDFFSISNRLDRIRQIWASMIDLTGPQWNIITALIYMDKGDGVSIGDVADRLHVKSTFVTAQSKLMEESGHLKRTPSEVDRRVVLLSVTPETITRMNSYFDMRRDINQRLFGHLSGKDFKEMVEQVESIRIRAEKALDLLRFNSQHRDK